MLTRPPARWRPSLIVAPSSAAPALGQFTEAFIQAVARHHNPARETDPPQV